MDMVWLAGHTGLSLSFTQSFIDAAHDYTNVHQDILAYWSKVKPNVVLAGHDFNHHRNWAGILEKRIEYSKSAAGERPLSRTCALHVARHIDAQGHRMAPTSKAKPVRPVSADQATGWPRLAGARGNLRHALALREASGGPAGRGLRHLVSDIGKRGKRIPPSYGVGQALT